MSDRAVDWSAVRAELDHIKSKLEPLNVDAEICGNWVWLSGNTEKHKHYLKNLGFRYSNSKEMWFYIPPSLPDTEKNGDQEYTMDDIRQRHGSKVFKNIKKLNQAHRNYAKRKINSSEVTAINTFFSKLFTLFVLVYR